MSVWESFLKNINRGDNMCIFTIGRMHPFHKGHKELVCELLDDYGIHHQTLSMARTGVAGLLFEMIVHQGRILRNIIWDKPDVIAALGGPLCTHISRLRCCPVAIFTDTHIAKWGWRVSEDGWVNFPDWQMRVYRNDDNIYWVKPVHEQLKGYTKFANLPAEEKYALYHAKDIGRQEKQNQFYDTI